MRIMRKLFGARSAPAAQNGDGDTERKPKRVPREIEVAARMAAPPHSQNATPGIGVGFGS